MQRTADVPIGTAERVSDGLQHLSERWSDLNCTLAGRPSAEPVIASQAKRRCCSLFVTTFVTRAAEAPCTQLNVPRKKIPCMHEELPNR